MGKILQPDVPAMSGRMEVTPSPVPIRPFSISPMSSIESTQLTSSTTFCEICSEYQTSELDLHIHTLMHKVKVPVNCMSLSKVNHTLNLIQIEKPV